jgi:transcriptional regulator with PAS, ATPase and Fis domain
VEAQRAARSSAKVLITGESGVGKEVLAHLIHAQSARRARPFVIVNCAGVPDTLLESEFFGHTRGSFTGAYRDHVGLLQRAEGGTVFLDEVGEMSERLQVMLLRFLETSEIQRVGGTGGHVQVDVRVVAATNRDLHRRVTDGAFREDLFYRLNVIHLQMAPLRERPDDIEPLLHHFLGEFAAKYRAAVPLLSSAAIAVLTSYPWPGNARELRNVAERIIIHHPATLDADQVPSLIGPRATELVSAPRASVVVSHTANADRLFAAMVDHGQPFWTVVHAPYLARTLTRDDVRAVIHLGLQQSRGSYRQLLHVFNLPPTDYKRFLNFLNSAECQLPFQDYRPGYRGRRAVDRLAE